MIKRDMSTYSDAEVVFWAHAKFESQKSCARNQRDKRKSYMVEFAHFMEELRRRRLV